MNITYTPEKLIAFEDKVVQMYRKGKIKAPLHLSGGNEKELIEIFKEIEPDDFIFTTYRSHYHSLLKGMPEQKLLDWILDLRSIHVMDNECNIFSSAIVGGTLPIALGVAMSKKINKESGKVWCFIGDMTASLGTFFDCLKYAYNFNLPIVFVIEDNGLSTDTKTEEVWGFRAGELEQLYINLANFYPKIIKYYKYTRTRPHYGIGEFVIFDDENKKDSGRSF